MNANIVEYVSAYERGIVMIKAVNYKPRFPISSGAPCALASLFTSLQHFL